MAGIQGGGLSSEQIRRMEENRKQAQQRLSNKRTAESISKVPVSAVTSMTSTPQFVTAPQPTQCGPPPAKRPALNPGPSHHQYQQHHERKIGPPPKLLPSDHSSSLYASGQTSTGSSVMLQRRPVDSTVASTSTSYKRPSQACSGSLSMPTSQSGGQVGTSRRDTGPAVMGGGGVVASAATSSSVQKVLWGEGTCDHS